MSGLKKKQDPTIGRYKRGNYYRKILFAWIRKNRPDVYRAAVEESHRKYPVRRKNAKLPTSLAKLK